MPDQTNLVSADLTPEQQTESLSLIDRLRAIFSFFITIQDKEKRYLLFPGLKGLDAIEQVVATVRKYQAHFPPHVVESLPEIERDLRLVRTLKPVVKALQTITRSAEDTLNAARSDAFRGGLVAYAIGKPLGKVVVGLAKDLEPLREFFDRRQSTKPPATEE